jgi:hypothetical protein
MKNQAIEQIISLMEIHSITDTDISKYKLDKAIISFKEKTGLPFIKISHCHQTKSDGMYFGVVDTIYFTKINGINVTIDSSVEILVADIDPIYDKIEDDFLIYDPEFGVDKEEHQIEESDFPKLFNMSFKEFLEEFEKIDILYSNHYSNGWSEKPIVINTWE